MPDITRITDSIHSFPVPYKDIFVQIYILQTGAGAVLFDAAGCPEDVDNYILPALKTLDIVPTHIFISHNHGDHAGGLSRAAALFPNAQIVSCCESLREQYPGLCHPQDGDLLLDVLQVVSIPGHTPDAAALLDLRTNTLVTGDCLQSYGIYGSGFWYGAIPFPAEHLAAIEKLRALPIETVATAHDYHPCGVVSFGKEAVRQRLDTSACALERLAAAIRQHPALDAPELAVLCNDGTLPKVAPRILVAIRHAIAQGIL